MKEHSDKAQYCVICDEYWENDTYIYCPYCGKELR
jgi:hypothetical protein